MALFITRFYLRFYPFWEGGPVYAFLVVEWQLFLYNVHMFNFYFEAFGLPGFESITIKILFLLDKWEIKEEINK